MSVSDIAGKPLQRLVYEWGFQSLSTSQMKTNILICTCCLTVASDLRFYEVNTVHNKTHPSDNRPINLFVKKRSLYDSKSRKASNPITQQVYTQQISPEWVDNACPISWNHSPDARFGTGNMEPCHWLLGTTRNNCEANLCFLGSKKWTCWAVTKYTGCLEYIRYIRGYTTQLYRNYNKPLTRIPINQPVLHGM